MRCRSSISPLRRDGRERRCLGFARAFDDPSMQIAGWYCSARSEVVDRAAARLRARPADHSLRRRRFQGGRLVRARRAQAQLLRPAQSDPGGDARGPKTRAEPRCGRGHVHHQANVEIAGRAPLARDALAAHAKRRAALRSRRDLDGCTGAVERRDLHLRALDRLAHPDRDLRGGGRRLRA